MISRKRKKRLFIFDIKTGKKIVVFAIFLFLMFFFFKIFSCIFKTDKWERDEKLSLLVENDDNFVNLIVFDPNLYEIHKVKIPKNTEIRVSGGYGYWKIGSLWELGKQENFSGSLLVRTITMSMKLPVYSWAEVPASIFDRVSLKDLLKFLYLRYKTNLSLGDRLQIILFNFKVKGSGRSEVNLGETTFLEKVKLSDDSSGYQVTKVLPQEIVSIFSEPFLSENMVRVLIKDATGSESKSREVGYIVEILGSKVTAIEKINNFEGVCMLKAKSEKILRIFSKVFECEDKLVVNEISSDVEIVIGRNFAKFY